MGIITSADIASFAIERVNLSPEDAKDYRRQVEFLRERLTLYISDNPNFDLVKMYHSGSVAKGTALSTINDMDVAVYVKTGSTPKDESQLIPWLAKLLREVYPQMEFGQFIEQDHSVQVAFKSSGLKVDVVPVFYEVAADDSGWLVEKFTGKKILTSIPKHLEFIRSRKEKQPKHFAQVIRLVKWWVKKQKEENQYFKFKSFLIELIVAKLADGGQDLSDYIKALEAIFAYIVKSGLSQTISFSDYYSLGKLPKNDPGPIRAYDPVNPNNNVASGYSEAMRKQIVEAANDALDAITYANRATTKGVAVEQLKKIFGTGIGV